MLPITGAVDDTLLSASRCPCPASVELIRETVSDFFFRALKYFLASSAK
jgi:hypothetical protein